LTENYWTTLAETISDVKAIEIYGGGTIVVKRNEMGAGGNLPDSGERRGKVRSLSKRAMCRLLFVVTETRVQFGSMITLTYGKVYPTSGVDVKEDLNRLLTSIRARYKRASQVTPSYLWFLEFQRRGAPHVHVLITASPCSTMTREDLAKMWCAAQKLEGRLVKAGYGEEERAKERKKVVAVHMHKKTWEAIKSQNGATRYVSKYALKTKQKVVPKNFQDVGRFFGWSRDVASGIFPAAEVSVSEEDLRDLLKRNGHKTAGFDVLPKHIFGALQSSNNVSRET